MLREYVVFFVEGIPDFNLLIEALESKTGLSDFDFNGANLTHVELKSVVDFRLSKHKNLLIIEAFNGRTHYLEGMVIATLEELGAQHNHSLPPWTNKKWADIPEKLKKKIL